MDSHYTHLVSDGTLSGNFYKYDDSGKLIVDSNDDINNLKSSKEINKKEDLLDNNKYNFMNNYDKDFDIDNLDLLNTVKQLDKKEKEINDILKNNELKNDINNIDSYEILNDDINNMDNNMLYFLGRKKENVNEELLIDNAINNEKKNDEIINYNQDKTVINEKESNKNVSKNIIFPIDNISIIESKDNYKNNKSNGSNIINIKKLFNQKCYINNTNKKYKNNELIENKKKINFTYPNISNISNNNQNSTNSYSKTYNKDCSNNLHLSKCIELKNNINEKNIIENILILPNIKRMFITKLRINEKHYNRAINKSNTKLLPSISNDCYFCTKERISSRITTMLKTYISNSRNPHDIKSNCLEKQKEKVNKLEKGKVINLFNKNKNRIKYMKIPIIKTNDNTDNSKNKKSFYSPIIQKIAHKDFTIKIEKQDKSKKCLNIKHYIQNVNNNKNKNGNILTKIIKKKKIQNINKILNINKLYNSIDSNDMSNHNLKKIKDNTNNKIYDNHNDITRFNSYSSRRKNTPFRLSKIERIKCALLKNKVLIKTINKKDNNLLVHIEGFKKHYGSEEKCPLCCKRVNDGIKKKDSTTINKIHIKNNNIKQNVHENQESNIFFQNNIKKKKKENITFNSEKKIFGSYASYSLSSPFCNKKKQEKRKDFPVIFNYYGY